MQTLNQTAQKIHATMILLMNHQSSTTLFRCHRMSAPLSFAILISGQHNLRACVSFNVDANLDPQPQEYLSKLAKALDFDMPAYAHVSYDILLKFKTFLRQYPETFYLPDAHVSCIEGFHRNIDAVDAPTVYSPPPPP